MAETVGTKTKQKTSAGKDVYKTLEGESVSEKSVTIKFGDGAYVNAPSIHEGKQYTEDEIKKMLLEGIIKPTSRHDTLEEAIKAAKARSDNLLKDGGMALAKQMELFDEGGLMQEGGTVDPISGNDVPIGSTQEEVRDDIPAQLSEGEFVMPADVVRYHGLDKMMALRDEAKIGLQRMKDMGQMGNSEEAIIPDGIPFNMEDLELEEEPMEMQVGGAVLPNVNTTNTYSQPSMFANYQQIPGNQPLNYNSGYNNYGSFFGQPYGNINPVFTEPVPGGTTTKPPYSFGDLIPTIGGISETREYRNQAGQSLYIPFINGEPVYPIPDGYTEYKAEDIADVAPDPELPTNVETGNGGNNDDANSFTNVSSGTSKIKSVSGLINSLFGTDEPKKEPKTLQQSLFDDAEVFGGSSKFGLSNKDLRKATGIQALSQVSGIFPTSAITAAMAKEFGITNFTPNDVAIAGNTAKNTALSHLGYGTAGQLTSDSQASLLGKTMIAAQTAAKKGLNPDAAIRGVLDTEEGARVRNEAATNLKNSIFSDNINATFAEAAKGATVLANEYRNEALNFVNPDTNKGIVTSMVYNPTTKTMEKRAVKDTRGNAVLKESARKGRDKAIATADALDKASGVFSIQAEIENGTRDPVTNVVTRDPSTIGPGSVGYVDSYDEDRGDPSGGYPGTDSAPGGSTDTGTDFGDSYNQGYNQDDVLGPGEEYDDDFSLDTSGSYVTESSTGSDDSDSKIVCTAMNNAYGFGSFRQAIWLQHSKNMDPAYQKGYHRIFRPLIKIAYRNTKWYNIAVRKMLEGIARRRTADIWMQKKGKRHFVGAVERAILEPVCYIVGKIK